MTTAGAISAEPKTSSGRRPISYRAQRSANCSLAVLELVTESQLLGTTAPKNPPGRAKSTIRSKNASATCFRDPLSDRTSRQGGFETTAAAFWLSWMTRECIPLDNAAFRSVRKGVHQQREPRDFNREWIDIKPKY